MAMPAQQKALRKLLRENPCSMLTLARVSGVPHSNLIEARDGIRPVSEGMAARVEAGLRQLAITFNRLADEMEAATKGESR